MVKANHFLLLSGTPAQNKLADLDVPLALLLHDSRRKSFREIEGAYRKLNKPLKPSKKKDMKDCDIVDSVDMTDVRTLSTSL